MGKKMQARREKRKAQREAKRDAKARRKAFRKGQITYDEYSNNFSDSDLLRMNLDQQEKEYQREQEAIKQQQEAERQAQEMELKRQQMELQAIANGVSSEQVSSVVNGGNSLGCLGVTLVLLALPFCGLASLVYYLI